LTADHQSPVPLSFLRLSGWQQGIVFILFYVFLDWVSYVKPLFGFNITPWDPGPAFGLVCWLQYGRRISLPWYIALIICEYVTRGAPEGFTATLLLSAVLMAGYAAIAHTLTRAYPKKKIFRTRRDLLIWLGVVGVGSLVLSAAYIAALTLPGYIPQDQWVRAYIRFGVGEIVGITVSMPLFWILLNPHDRGKFFPLLFSAEIWADITLLLLLLWMIFTLVGITEFTHFYFLFLPLVWAAARFGLAGACLQAFLLQIIFITAVEKVFAIDVPVDELQLLVAVLGLTTFFVGVVVDEQRQISEELRQTIRLASAGEMAAALAHELNQPMAAFSAYATACENLLLQGKYDQLMVDAVRKMLDQSKRATNVVKRLRDFFRTGAMHLEKKNIALLVAHCAESFVPQAKSQGVTVIIDADTDVAALVDEIQLEVVMRNLLTNAIESVQACAAEEKWVRVTMALTMGHKVQVSVEDSGSGISEALSERLFKSFSSTKPRGMGLGLVVSRSIIEAHGGNLWVEHADHGIFKFTLPVMTANDDEAK
jgi:signal transduction histidine kinase